VTCPINRVIVCKATSIKFSVFRPETHLHEGRWSISIIPLQDWQFFKPFICLITAIANSLITLQACTLHCKNITQVSIYIDELAASGNNLSSLYNMQKNSTFTDRCGQQTFICSDLRIIVLLLSPCRLRANTVAASAACTCCCCCLCFLLLQCLLLLQC